MTGESLSFISAWDKAVLGRVTPSAAPSSGPTPAPSGTVPRSSAEDAARSKEAPAAGGTQTYYVQYTDKSGQAQMKKLSVGQILQALRGGIIDHRAKAKKAVNGQFVPLAQFTEFASLVQKKAASARAEAKAGSLAAEFARIDKQFQRRGLMRWLRNMMTNIKGLTILAIYLALIGAGLWAAWTYGVPWIQAKMSGG
jgi:hypothetical protein